MPNGFELYPHQKVMLEFMQSNVWMFTKCVPPPSGKTPTALPLIRIDVKRPTYPNYRDTVSVTDFRSQISAGIKAMMAAIPVTQPHFQKRFRVKQGIVK